MSKLDFIGCLQLLNIGSFKLNTNGALFDDLQAIDFGFFPRDINEDVLLAANMKDKVIHLLETIESLAIIRGL